MKFFVPDAKDAEMERRIWEATVTFSKSQVGRDVSDRRIFKMDFEHNGKDFVAEVGKTLGDGVHEKVLVILDAGDMYLVCTNNRGVMRGFPYLVGKSSAHSVEDFDA